MPDAAADAALKPKHVVVGAADNFWFHSTELGWDLTHPASRDAEPFSSGLSLDCDLSNVAIDPAKTALLIIDMQNLSLSAAICDNVTPSLRHAEDMIKNFAIPAARKADIQIVWLNWGLTEDELHALPPSVLWVFGWTENGGPNNMEAPTPSEAPNGINAFPRLW